MTSIIKFIIIAAICINVSQSSNIIELAKSKFTEYTTGVLSSDPADSSDTITTFETSVTSKPSTTTLKSISTTNDPLECNDNLQDFKAEILNETERIFEDRFTATYDNFEERMQAFSDNLNAKLRDFSRVQQPAPEVKPRPPKPSQDEIFQRVTDIFEQEDQIENLRNKFSKQIDEKFEEEVTIIDGKIEEISGRIEVQQDIEDIEKVFKILDELKEKYTKMEEKFYILSEYTKETTALRKENAFLKVEATHLKSEIADLKREQEDLRELIERNRQEINSNFNIFEFKHVDLSHQICKLRSETHRDLEYLKQLTIHPKSMLSFKEDLQEFQERFDTYAMEVPSRDEDRHPGIHAELLKGFKSSMQELFDKIEELRMESNFSEQEHQIKIMKRKLKNLEMNFEDFKNNPLRVVHPNEAKHAEQHGRMKVFRLGKRLLLKKV